MPHTPAEPSLSRALLDSLVPLLRHVNTARTLSVGKLGILRHLAQNGQATTAELASVVQVSPQAISLATRELEDLGLVARTPDSEDRRRVWFSITDDGGQKLADESERGERVLDAAIAASLNAAEKETLRTAIPLLDRLASADRDG